MGENSFTPGPWEARYSDRFDNYQIFGPGRRGTRPWICNTKCESVPAHHEGNARLIAAAPELLQALRELVELVDDPANDADPEESAISFAKSIIAKAEGTASSASKEAQNG